MSVMFKYLLVLTFVHCAFAEEVFGKERILKEVNKKLEILQGVPKFFTTSAEMAPALEVAFSGLLQQLPASMKHPKDKTLLKELLIEMKPLMINRPDQMAYFKHLENMYQLFKDQLNRARDGDVKKSKYWKMIGKYITSPLMST